MKKGQKTASAFYRKNPVFSFDIQPKYRKYRYDVRFVSNLANLDAKAALDDAINQLLKPNNPCI